MADFDGFEDNFSQPVMADDDPAADFLAREQDELAGLDDESFVVNGGTSDSGNFDDFTVVPDMNGPVQSEPEEQSHHPLPPLIPKEVPEKIRKWKEEQENMLTAKDANEETKKEELKENAKHELDEWYRHHTEQVEKTKDQNREASKNAEKEYVMDRDSDVAGQEWERIAKLCDFNPKSCRNTKDVSRMRSIILQLKQTPLARS